MGKKKPNDHFLSKVYMKPFLPSGEKKLWVYDKQSLSCRLKGRGEICFIRNGSTNKLIESNPRLIEEVLVPIENNWFQMTENLKAFLEGTRRRAAYLEMKKIISEYLAVLIQATPSNKQQRKLATESLIDLTAKILEKQGAFPPRPKELEGVDLKALITETDWVELIALKGLPKTIERFSQSKFVFLQNNSDTPFVTSDNPVCYINEGVGHNCIIYFPLTPQLGLLVATGSASFNGSEDSSEECTVSLVKKLNQLVIKAAEQYVISSIESEELKELVEKFKNFKQGCVTQQIGPLLVNQVRQFER